MVRLVRYVTHADLCQQIVGQFAFMKAMSRPGDRNFKKLQTLSLDDVFEKADEHFIQYVDDFEVIDTTAHKLDKKITAFLQQWNSIVDITAIQQNVHYSLKLSDKR